jgi:hypothetical protein
VDGQGSLQQPDNALLEDRVGRQPDRVFAALGLIAAPDGGLQPTIDDFADIGTASHGWSAFADHDARGARAGRHPIQLLMKVLADIRGPNQVASPHPAILRSEPRRRPAGPGQPSRSDREAAWG